MSIALIVPLLVCIVGLLVYALATNAKVVTIGDRMFFAGLLVTLFMVGKAWVHL